MNWTWCEEFAMHAKARKFLCMNQDLKHAFGCRLMQCTNRRSHCHNIHDTGFTAEQSIANWKALGVLEPVPYESPVLTR